ncbi:hypothetical protein CEP54_001983 [Fusarium duplospermum]|uniref:Uncharacterized protein n=1 Tax=Fusarium duplospermum TaxID=1325734 RepID=A0A428QXF2_9HYPO|nr:hypothetical protein CEP54_001983 [Fusarium duplospermum]
MMMHRTTNVFFVIVEAEITQPEDRIGQRPMFSHHLVQKFRPEQTQSRGNLNVCAGRCRDKKEEQPQYYDP